ncbi:hypothetical protein TrRE_jg4839 [Triparma retinervis]|uniref:Uncharacterized protein n=1 Tax=Triparma retinervis TaxID=2557542 RepID=A0A9W6ZW69_9STRA|nr:hypothetical protein TrRE_jg4839 [Triparma retinervis]
MNPCYNLPTRRVAQGNGVVLTITQASTSQGMAGRTGVAVWNSCILLSRWISNLAASPQLLSLFQGRDVLELGCGTGLASLVSAPLANSVLATDGNAEVVELAKRNSEKNLNARPKDNVKVAEMKWGTMGVPVELYSTVDTVFGSDLTYNSGSWRALGETIGAVLRPNNGKVVYLATGHDGFKVQGELDGFLSVISGEGLKLNQPLTDAANQLLGRLLSQEERALLASTGGARIVVLEL